MLGFPLADPIIGLLIALSILVLLWGTVKSIGARLMDAVDPALVDRAEHALTHSDGVVSAPSIRLRWVGHRLRGTASIAVNTDSLREAQHIADHAAEHVRRELRNLDSFTVTSIQREDAADPR